MTLPLRKDIKDLLKSKSGIRLDIACGDINQKQPGFVGMDIRDVPGVDIVWDVEKFPWPLPDECVLTAVASHIVEHIDPHGGTFIKFMDEAWRVLKPEGQIAIATPYAGSQGYWQDPTHCNPCNEVTWCYFDPLEPNTKGELYKVYHPKPWKIEHSGWSHSGNMEVILSKRRIDQTYGVYKADKEQVYETGNNKRK